MRLFVLADKSRGFMRNVHTPRSIHLNTTDDLQLFFFFFLKNYLACFPARYIFTGLISVGLAIIYGLKVKSLMKNNE